MTEKQPLPDHQSDAAEQPAELVESQPPQATGGSDAAMLTARRIVENHIENWSYIDHPDLLKDAIASALSSAAPQATGGEWPKPMPKLEAVAWLVLDGRHIPLKDNERDQILAALRASAAPLPPQTAVVGEEEIARLAEPLSEITAEIDGFRRGIEAAAKLCETYVLYHAGPDSIELVPSKSSGPIGRVFAEAIRALTDRGSGK